MKTEILTPEFVRKICVAARETGLFQRRERLVFDPSRVEEKNLHDYVSYVDRESERRLVAALSRLLPSAGFITEEATAAYSGEDWCWIIDPLDGTTNYVHGASPYAVSVALAHLTDGIVAGVVYEPCRDECFWALKGGGAYLDDRRIGVSPVAALEAAYIHVGLPYDAVCHGAAVSALLHRFYGKVGGVRICGSAAMDICDVAAGRVDAYVEPALHIWDIAAGMLILREAGGSTVDFSGADWLDAAPDPRGWASSPFDVVAANASLQKAFLQAVRECL